MPAALISVCVLCAKRPANKLSLIIKEAIPMIQHKDGEKETDCKKYLWNFQYVFWVGIHRTL